MDTTHIRMANLPQTSDHGVVRKTTTDAEVDEIFDLNQLFAQLEAIDLEKLGEQVERAKTPLVKTIEALQKNEKLITRKKAKKKVHYKTRRKSRNEYYARVVAPKRKARIAEEMKEGGWWPRMTDTWNRKKVEVLLTRQEWEEVVLPLLGEGVPNINRYQPKEPISLGNIWVVDSHSGRVVFDGKEHILREGGYIL